MGQKHSIDTLPEESQMVRCPQKPNQKCCSQFDTSGAKNHQGLIRVIGNGDWSIASKIIDQKFNELQSKLEDFSLTPCNQAVIIILFLIPFVNFLVCCGYCCYRVKKIDKIIESNFDDWKELGIQVDYCVPTDEYIYRPPYILFTLPRSVPDIASLV